MLHVNPQLERKGLLVVYDPLDEVRTCVLDLDLYYTGLVDTARLRRDSSFEFEVTVPVGGMTWYVFE